MINSSQTINHSKIWFDSKKYINLQREKILERINKFKWTLYLEIWWKFMYDAHASRVLPWFNPESKKIIFYELRKEIEILFCVNAEDIAINRQITNENLNYFEHIKNSITEIENNLGIKPKVIINKVSNSNLEKVNILKINLEKEWYEVYKRYKINWYPYNTENILSKNWFWKDDYVKTSKKLILVTWIASSSWKMSTCLWQMYLDYTNWVESWYAKYETFPIWNIDLNHPINLAYEAATADIWDYNQYDLFHEKSYNIKSVNYNRDIEAFNIIKSIIINFIPKSNYMSTYKSPTDMWISNAWFCIIDDLICSNASLKEITRRKKWYKEIYERGNWNIEWVKKCESLEKKCENYVKNFKN